MALKQRLERIELMLKAEVTFSVPEPQYLDLLTIPKENLIETLDILKSATGGYQCLLLNTSGDVLSEINQLTPEQFYEELIAVRRSEGAVI